MTDRPILFSAEMVRAILDGRKTQTRRLMKVQPYPDSIVTVEHYHQTVIDRHGDMQPGKEIFGAHWDDGEFGLRCPYGAPGDQLWVRETWAPLADCVVLNCAYYRADGEHVTLIDGDGFTQTNRDGSEKSAWRPSIHMPRWASRITLRITDIRVERLQDISEDDALAEGAPRLLWDGEGAFYDSPTGQHRVGFAGLWNHINGPGAWDANPWVWVVAFERVKP
jgi:hypothetical protein